MNRCLLLAAILCPMLAFAAPLAEVYREAKAALEAGDAARCAELLEPALKVPGDADPAPAQLALGIAWLRLEKTEPAIEMLTKAAARFDGTVMAPNAYAPLGDALRKAGRGKDASDAYAKAAIGDLPNSQYAKARLSELEGERAEASGEMTKAAESYLVAADTLLAIGDYLADARALYEKVAKGTGKPKDWRGEPTARAVFGMGEVERARKQWPEAIAYYQHVFVSWVKYPKWAAKAYLRAAEGMDQLGKRDFAIRHLREMIRKVEKYGALPEYEQAKAQLRAWGEDIQ